MTERRVDPMLMSGRTSTLRSSSSKLPEPVPEHGEAGQPWETNLFKNAWQFAEQVDCLPIGLAKLDAKDVENEHRPVGEPAPLGGSGGVV